MATPVELQLPPIPVEVVVQLVLPHAFDRLAQALDLMLVCRAAFRHATTKREFWEPFLWRRLHESVIPWLESAYTTYATNLVNLLRTKYVMWPKVLTEGRDILDVVRSKFFVAQQVPDLWGDLNPVVCKECHDIVRPPWWRCLDCEKPYFVCIRCSRTDESSSDESEDEEDDEALSGEEEDEENKQAEDVEQEQEQEQREEEGDGGAITQEGAEPSPEEEGNGEAAAGTESEDPEEDKHEQEEEDDDDKPKHKDTHAMQLVIDSPPCSSCAEPAPLRDTWWICRTCLGKGRFFGLCDSCHNDPAGLQARLQQDKRSRHQVTGHELAKWGQEEFANGVDRWSIEDPHPALSFKAAWEDKEQYSSLYLLKLYSPTFTNYGCYVCFFEDRPSLTEGWIVNGSISEGIKYTGWDKPSDVHIYQGTFGPTEGFPLGSGQIEWQSGLKFEGQFKLHTQYGQGCTITLPDGTQWKGDLTPDGWFRSRGKGTLTLPSGLQKHCMVETGHGRLNLFHLFTLNDRPERFLLYMERALLEAVDEFPDSDKEEASSDSDTDTGPTGSGQGDQEKAAEGALEEDVEQPH